MADNLVIAVATHKDYPMPADSAYLPLHVGAALHPGVCNGMQGDDSGDNISRKNDKYCELTGLYWMWRNCKSDYKGLVHYRRHFGTLDPLRKKARDPFERIATYDDIMSVLRKGDIVVAKQRHYYIETIYDHYKHTFDSQHFDQCREVLNRRCPEYVEAWDNLMSSRSAHIFNMFVMRSDLFNAYCAWLFPILNELEDSIDSSQYSPFEARYLGRISERLLDPWIETNALIVKELPIVSPEKVDWISKGSGFLKAKFLGKKYERSF